MVKYVVNRIIQGFFLLFIVIVVTFFSLYLTGDPVSLMLPSTATLDQIRQMREALGFNKPLIQQFFIYLTNLLHGDMGQSLHYNEPALKLILDALPNTLILSFTAIIIAIVIGIILGICSASSKNVLINLISLILSTIGQAIPVFWLGILIIKLFAVDLRWFPVSGFQQWSCLALPALTLGLYSSGRITRLVHSEMLDSMGKNYIQVAKAKGLSKKAVMLKHVFRSSAVPVVTMIGLEMNTIIGGAVVTETVFSWPGIGRMLVSSAVTRDFPMTRACLLIICILFLIVNLVVDIAYSMLDPRISYKK